MTSQYHTKEENELLKGMDDLLNNRNKLTDYWAGSAGQSVINNYKEGKVKNV